MPDYVSIMANSILCWNQEEIQTMTETKDLSKIKQLLDAAEANLRQVKEILFSAELSKKASSLTHGDSSKIIEGVFNGEAMVGPDEKHYPVPANYASKSKLVCGDILKLTILEDGSFLYKQIGPVKRIKIIGELGEEIDGRFRVKCDDKNYNVLPASVTYFKARPGDKLTVMVPEDGAVEWAAVENLYESR